MMIETIEAPRTWDGCEGTLAIIVRGGMAESGIQFVTNPEMPQQVALMHYRTGHTIPAHTHHRINRTISVTQEVLLVRKGTIRVYLYSSAQEPICHRDIGAGDLIVLVSGGHKIEVLEEVDMVEVKQGPYVGRELDKKLI